MSDSHLTYYEIILQCVQAVKNVEVWLDIAERAAEEKKFDVDVLLDRRLAPDMKNFIYQVQVACDYVKNGAAWLSEQTPPSYADDEATIDDLRARIQKTVNFAEGIKEGLYANAGSQRVKISWLPNRVVLGKNYLLQIIVPNVFFHVGMAYAILRSNGVDIGKMDFINPIYFVDA